METSNKMLLKTTRSAGNGGKGFLRRYAARSVLDTADKDGELRVFLVSGEVSGDTIGSRLMSSLKELSPLPLRFSGVGGSMMRKEGLECIFPMEDISVMGLWELLPHLYKFRVRLKETVEQALAFRPHAVVTVDSKGFSFQFLKQLRARRGGRDGVDGPVHFHFVAPSFWAWKGGEARLKGLAGFVDHLFCILPNEDVVCRSHGLKATFVGHPVLEDAPELLKGQKSQYEQRIKGNAEAFIRKYALPSGAMAISVLPGSRLQEVTRMLPIFRSTIEQLKDSFPELVTVIHVAPNQHVDDYIRGFLHKWPVPNVLVSGGNSRLKFDAFSISQVALCTSGTVALELQLARLPCVVAYRAHLLTEWFIKYKAKIPYISLPNILLDSAIIPEALFQECSPANLASLLIGLMSSNKLREEQKLGAEKLTKLLVPSERVISSFKGRNSSSKFKDWSPSLIAASTILGHERSQGFFTVICCSKA